ncbi:MAG: DUF5615 family PIN-like protein [Gemmataceae bacterium]
MTPVQFLLDENIPEPVVGALRRAEPSIVYFYSGTDSDTPPKGTLDPQVLAFAEEKGLALVTFDKRSMPGHVADHLAAGRHTWGVFLFPNGNQLSAGRVAEELVMVWAASTKDEWIDRFENLPY